MAAAGTLGNDTPTDGTIGQANLRNQYGLDPQ